MGEILDAFYKCVKSNKGNIKPELEWSRNLKWGTNSSPKLNNFCSRTPQQVWPLPWRSRGEYLYRYTVWPYLVAQNEDAGEYDQVEEYEKAGEDEFPSVEQLVPVLEGLAHERRHHLNHGVGAGRRGERLRITSKMSWFVALWGLSRYGDL